jgi:hypothetical protein
MPSPRTDLRLFNAFNKHQTIEIIDFNPRDYYIKYRDEEGRIQKDVYLPLGIMESSMVEGRMIDVQFGKVTKTDIENVGKRKLSYQARKISAIRHPKPRITPLALSIMRASLGREGTRLVLLDYLDKANTNQNKTSYQVEDQVFNLRLEYGNIKVETNYRNKVQTVDQGVFLSEDLPDTALLTMKDRDIGDVIGHEAFKNGGKIHRCNRRENKKDKSTEIYIHLCPDYFFVEEIVGD